MPYGFADGVSATEAVLLGFIGLNILFSATFLVSLAFRRRVRAD